MEGRQAGHLQEVVGCGVGGAPTSDDTVNGLLEVFGVDGGVQVAGGDQRRLVAHVGDVGA